MRLLRNRLLLTGVLAISSATPSLVSAQQTAVATTVPTRGVIDGLVTDDDLGRIAMADVSILSSPVRVTTSEGGRFRITDMAPGPYAVVVRKLGFQPLAAIVHIAAGDTARLTFSLQRLAVGLDTVRITERASSWKMEGFDRRRKAGIGHYASVDDIARWGGYDLGNFLRRFATIAIRPNEKTGEMSIESVRARGFLKGNCAMKVIVDDVPMPSGIGLSMLPRLDEISGIEVYTGPSTVPAQFVMSGVGCGAIIFWTKSGS
jgi:hypothetical protein